MTTTIVTILVVILRVHPQLGWQSVPAQKDHGQSSWMSISFSLNRPSTCFNLICLQTMGLLFVWTRARARTPVFVLWWHLCVQGHEGCRYFSQTSLYSDTTLYSKYGIIDPCLWERCAGDVLTSGGISWSCYRGVSRPWGDAEGVGGVGPRPGGGCARLQPYQPWRGGEVSSAY